MHQLRKKKILCNLQKLDKYYTKKNVVEKCLQNICLKDYDCVIEPSAGNGVFYHAISHSNKIGLDILPDDKHIIQADWLKYMINKKYKSVLVIGNPPFGQYHMLSKQFIQHSLSFDNVKTIAFILPQVYKKHTRQQIISARWRIKDIIDLPKDSFTIGNKDFHIASSFFIIDKSIGKDLRTPCLTHIKETDDFEFGTREDYDIFVFGASPKKVISNPKSNNRGYFLKSKIPKNELTDKIKEISWQGNSCANGGVYWLNKTEFLQQYLSHYHCNNDKGKLAK